MSIIDTEIHTQYDALERTHEALLDNMHAIAGAISGSKIAFLGCGSSYSIAKSAALMARLRLNVQAEAIAAGDLLIHTETYAKLLQGATIVILSRSGETSEAVRAVEALRARGVDFTLVSIVCVEDSTLSELSDVAVELPWAFDESVCQTRTVTNLYYFCLMLIAGCSGDDDMIKALDWVRKQGKAFMARAEAMLKPLAKLGWTHGVVLGDAELCGICDEAALTFKEICQLPSNYYHLLDVRHGPMVLIGKDTVVAVVLTGHALEQDLVNDLVKKGALVITYSDLPIEIEGATNISFGAVLPHAARGVPFIQMLQLLTYYKSFETNADPDAPTGLSAWIELK